MRTIEGDGWKRGGLSLLWGAEALADLASPAEVASIRDFIGYASHWPQTLPSHTGRTLVVAGVEGCLDCLSPDDGRSWIEEDLRPLLLRFQEEYEQQRALVLWLPTGQRRIRQHPARETYSWQCAAPSSGEAIELGNLLWGGAEEDARHIIDSRSANRDPFGPGWIGLYHPRLS
jgi:hypothetical protein